MPLPLSISELLHGNAVEGVIGPESGPESLAQKDLRLLAITPASKAEISEKLGQKEVSGQLHKVMRDLIASGQVEYTLPDKPNSRLQKYRLP